MHFLELRCPNEPKEPGRDCRGQLAGPSIEALLQHDYVEGPFVDIRFCGKCHTYIEISINGLREIPHLRVLPEDERVSFVKFRQIFHLATREGRRVKQ